MRVVLWAVRVVALLAPALIVGAWGYTYIRLCLTTLANPHKAIQFSYKAPVGVVTIRAASYLIDLQRGVVLLWKPEIEDPAGGVLASAQWVEATDLDWHKGSDQKIELTIDHLAGKFVRFGNGAFQIADFLPRSGKSTSKVPFHVVVRKGNVELVDYVGGTWRQAAMTDLVEVTGVGNDWVATGEARLPGIGSGQAFVQNIPDEGVQVTASTTRFQVTTLLNHILQQPFVKRVPALRGISAKNVVISGPVSVFVPTEKAFLLQASVSVQADQVAYDKYQVSGFKFNGIVTAADAKGVAVAQMQGMQVKLWGAGSWQNGQEMAGQVDVHAPSTTALPAWVKSLLPPSLNFSNGSYTGWVAVKGRQPVTTRGTLKADRLAFRGEVAQSLSADLWASPASVRLTLLHGQTLGSSPRLSAAFNLQTKTMTAFVSGQSVNLDILQRLAQKVPLAGTASFAAQVAGPLASPTVRFETTGEGKYTGSSSMKIGRQAFDATGTYAKGHVVIDRGVVHSSAGVLTVSGSGDPQGALALHFDVRNVRAAGLYPGMSGQINGEGTLTGTVQDPHVTGRVEGVDMAYQKKSIPAATVDFVADRSRISATQLRAVSGTMSLEGTASMQVPGKKLDGSFKLTGIQAAQFFGNGVAGLIEAPDMHLRGTLSDPILLVGLQGSELVAKDVIFNSFDAHLRATRRDLVVDNVTALVGGGELSASGSYDFLNKTAEGYATSTDMQLSKLAPALSDTVMLGGTLSLHGIHATWKDGQLSGTAQGRLDKITANGAPAGDGNWSVTADGREVHGMVSIGQLLPELRVIDVDATYNLEQKTINGSFNADKARLSDLLASSYRYLPDVLKDNAGALLSLHGDVTVGANFSGDVGNLDVQIPTLNLADLAYEDEPLGTIDAPNLARKGGVWTIPAATLQGPEGSVTAKGTVAENGPIAMSALGKELHLSVLKPFVAGLTNSPATGSFSVVASGQTSHPSLNGSLSFSRLAPTPPIKGLSSSPQDELAITIPKLALSEGQFSASGTYAYDGFTGSISASSPFTYEDAFGTSPLQAKLTLDNRPIKAIPLLNAYLDPARSDGSVGGEINVTGPLDSLSYSGGLELDAKTLGIRFPDPNAPIKQVDDQLTNVTASLKVTDAHTLALLLKAGDVRGGTLTANVSTPVTGISTMTGGASDRLMHQILASAVSGSVKVDHLKLKQIFLGGYVQAEIDGSTTLGGTIERPAIGTSEQPGTFAISNLDSSPPNFTAGGGGSTQIEVNPSFFLKANLVNPAHFHTTAADLNLTGSATLEGPLSDPRANANFAVDHGSVHLPAGTLRIDPGGTVAFVYRKPFGDTSGASLNLDLEGHSSVSALRYGSNYQRYNVTVYLTGDLLSDSGLQMNAISDPPDLSSDDALALLGEKGLFESLGTGSQQQTANALLGGVLPTVSDPLTNVLAKGLGLDYVTIAYNPLNLTTVEAARALGANFSIQYRQQVGTPAPGQRSIYDLDLVYTPPLGRLSQRHLSFSIGSDQENPWKVAAEYGIRFGERGAGGTGAKTTISP